MPPQQERKVATVLFADLVGSTRIAHGHRDPERTRVLLDRFYDAMAREIERAGGTVEKFIGDAAMAVFGVPAALEDHADRALHVALAMQERMRELFQDELQLRIGVNTGEVVVGRTPDGSFATIGDAVNVAARLEQAARPGEILVGERTVAAARSAFELDEPIAIDAKGKPGGVRCWRLRQSLERAPTQPRARLGHSFVGRQSELDALDKAYRGAARSRQPHLVLVVGDAGVGKTRLVREHWDRLGTASPVPTRRRGACHPYGQENTYRPLADVLKEELGLRDGDPPERIRRVLGRRAILGLTLGYEVGGDLHPLVAREQLHRAWIELLDEFVAERPGVLLVEDLHWAEEPLLDALAQMASDVRGPLLLVGTARPTLLARRPDLGQGAYGRTVIRLEPLPAAQAERMLAELLGAPLPPALRETVLERADGNPFFVEELIATLLDRGVVRREHGSLSLDPIPEDFEVPDSIQAVLAARIDLLDPPEKAALQAASTIGRVFWRTPVVELLDGLDPDLHALEQREFVRARTDSSIPGEQEFELRHALTRDVAYSTLPKATRGRFHARFADWLEGVGDGRDEDAHRLAHHYSEALRSDYADLAWSGDEPEYRRLRDKATRWLRRAAELAVGRYAVDEALRLLERALALEPDRARQAELWQAIGRVNALRYDGEAFWTAMLNAVERTTDDRARGRLFSDLAFATESRPGMWKQRPDRELVKGWIDRALTSAAPESPAQARALIALALWDAQGGVESARRALGLAERLGDPELVSAARGAQAVTALVTHRYVDALELARGRLELIDQITDPDHREGIHWSLTFASLGCGRIEEARAHARRHAEVAKPLTPHHRVHALGVQLMVEELAGRWATVRDLAAEAEEVIALNVATPCQFNARSLLTCALAHAYDGEEAEAEAARLEREADAVAIEGYGLTIDAPRLRLALARERLDVVERLLEMFPPALYFGELAAVTARLDGLAALGQRVRLEREAAPVLVPGTYLEPFALRALGLAREEESMLHRAVLRFDALGLDWEAERTRTLTGARSGPVGP